MALGIPEGYSNWGVARNTIKAVGAPREILKNTLNYQFQNLTLGPADLDNTAGSVVDALWRISVKEDNKVYLAIAANETTWGEDSLFMTMNTTKMEYPTLAFDQLGKVLITWMENGKAWLYWYNPVSQQNEIKDLGVASSVTCCLDYPIPTVTVTSDIVIFTLLADGSLKYRLQSDRYDTIYDTSLKLLGATLFGGALREDNVLELEYGYAKHTGNALWTGLHLPWFNYRHHPDVVYDQDIQLGFSVFNFDAYGEYGIARDDANLLMKDGDRWKAPGSEAWVNLAVDLYNIEGENDYSNLIVDWYDIYLEVTPSDGITRRSKLIKRSGSFILEFQPEVSPGVFDANHKPPTPFSETNNSAKSFASPMSLAGQVILNSYDSVYPTDRNFLDWSCLLAGNLPININGDVFDVVMRAVRKDGSRPDLILTTKVELTA